MTIASPRRSWQHRLVVTWVTILAGCAVHGVVQAQDDSRLAKQVDAIFREWDRPDSPGCALGVYRDGAVAYTRGYGMADLERRVPISPRTIFDIGSTSKQFTAAAIVLLAQDRILTLDDEVRKWIPELPEYEQPITLRHLLLHTSGIRDYIGLLTLAGARMDDVTDAGDALRIIARQKALNFVPGSERLYSNSGYFLLSIVVERASKQTLQAFARDRIFRPLGMERTHFLGSYDDIVPDRALAYANRAGGGLRQDQPRWLQVGDGAVFTTVEELAQWDRNFYDPRIGGAALIDTLQRPGALSDGRPLTYALGLIVGRYRGLRTVSHGGGWGGYRAELLRFPDQRFSAAVLCNLGSTDPSDLARRVADVYLEGELAPAAGAKTESGTTVDSTILARYVGMYRNPVTRERLTVETVNGTLTLGGLSMRPRSATVFAADGTPAQWTFEPGTNGRPMRLRREQPGRDTEMLDKVQPLTLSEKQLSMYAGRFYSEELDTAWTLVVEKGVLLVRRRGAPPQRLTPVVADEFMAGGLTARFVRGPDGRVSSLTIDLGRVRNLAFTRLAADLPSRNP